MATCPKCRYHFRVLDDEDPRDFGCARCGYGQNRIACVYCNHEIEPDHNGDSEFGDYCSIECTVAADTDNQEGS